MKKTQVIFLLLFISSWAFGQNKIESTGSVGIGTTAPSNILDIEKNFNGSTFLEISNNSTGNKARRGITIGDGASGKTVSLISTSANYNEVSSWTNAGILSTDNQLSNGLVLRTSQGKIRFQPNGLTDKVVINPNGNVGVGTTAPSNILDIEKNFNGSTFLEISNNSTGNKARRGITIGDGASGKTVSLISTSANYNEVSSWTNAGILSTDSQLSNGLVLRTSQGKIRFQPKGTADKMIIDTNGNVGIGVSDPTEKLSVNGSIRGKEMTLEASPWPDYVLKNLMT